MKKITSQEAGKLAAGIPKNYSKAEIARRNKRLALARAKRWAGHKNKGKTV